VSQAEADPFDRLYARWAKQTVRANHDPPSRERWDMIVLRLILSEDPDRVRRYRYIETSGQDSLGADAFELWSKTPKYTPNLSVSREGFEVYEEAQRGSMRRLMEQQGLLERYDAIVAAQGQRVLTPEEKARAQRAQQQVLIMGCAGIGLIGVMVLIVLLIMAVKLLQG
jgi:hypothetical protein